MLGKADDGPKVHVTSKGAKYVDANELFQRPRVRQFVKSMKDIEKSPKHLKKSQRCPKVPRISN